MGKARQTRWAKRVHTAERHMGNAARDAALAWLTMDCSGERDVESFLKSEAGNALEVFVRHALHCAFWLGCAEGLSDEQKHQVYKALAELRDSESWTVVMGGETGEGGL